MSNTNFHQMEKRLPTTLENLPPSRHQPPTTFAKRSTSRSTTSYQSSEEATMKPMPPVSPQPVHHSPVTTIPYGPAYNLNSYHSTNTMVARNSMPTVSPQPVHHSPVTTIPYGPAYNLNSYHSTNTMVARNSMPTVSPQPVHHSPVTTIPYGAAYNLNSYHSTNTMVARNSMPKVSPQPVHHSPATTIPYGAVYNTSSHHSKTIATMKLPVVDNYPERKREALDHMASFRKGSKKLDPDTITFISSMLAVASGSDNALMVSGNVGITRSNTERVGPVTNNTKNISPVSTLRKQSKRNYRPAPEATIYPPDVRGQGDWPRVNHYHDESFHQSHFTPQQWQTRQNGTNRGKDCLFCTGPHYSDCPLYPTAKLRAAVFRKHHRCICCRGYHYPLPCSTSQQKNICTFKQCQMNGLLHDRLFCEVTRRERERGRVIGMHVRYEYHHHSPTN